MARRAVQGFIIWIGQKVHGTVYCLHLNLECSKKSFDRPSNRDGVRKYMVIRLTECDNCENPTKCKFGAMRDEVKIVCGECLCDNNVLTQNSYKPNSYSHIHIFVYAQCSSLGLRAHALYIHAPMDAYIHRYMYTDLTMHIPYGYQMHYVLKISPFSS